MRSLKKENPGAVQGEWGWGRRPLIVNESHSYRAEGNLSFYRKCTVL